MSSDYKYAYITIVFHWDLVKSSYFINYHPGAVCASLLILLQQGEYSDNYIATIALLYIIVI